LVVFDTEKPEFANVQAIADVVSASTRIPPALVPHEITVNGIFDFLLYKN
jgi:hypothetical protein